ncbi:Glucose/arabinose dehydrogenase, beta-propeller fold [Kriegella aquimaris]|uniref:Glucose/arabinose dehydrogenase, beta-propeller fold n=2 Tax=Kriegella aquimaris TaxID=192904 RepID=A0A1G9VFB3_9FLAO|nr:Glucose/arabinose dehydrogenase, beta-propeller fold [Kriegella aquimaris]
MNITLEHKINLPIQLLMCSVFALAVILSPGTSLQAQVQPSLIPDNMNAMDHGPFATSTIAYDPVTTNNIAVHKGIAVKVGNNSQAVMVFDTDLLRVSSAWTGGFLYWNMDERNGLEDWPTPNGFTHFETGKATGWSLEKEFDDPRTWPYGPIKKERGNYNGLYVNDKEVLFSYSIGESEILETPGFEQIATHDVFTRTFKVSPTQKEETLSLRVLQAPSGASLEVVPVANSKGYLKIKAGNNTRVIGFQGAVGDVKWRIKKSHLILDLPKLTQPVQFKLAIGPITSGEESGYMKKYLEQASTLRDISELKKPGPDQWKTLQTKAVMGQEDGPFAVDELTLPIPNPWNSYLRLTDIDFFSDGRAVVTSISGDVWIVDGIKDNLETLSWHRYATGLYQPLGVKVVKGQVYVTGRDQITRLHDYNDDGFADYYESFNNDLMASTNFHAFTMNLETDAQGNFYFAKSTPWPPYVQGEGLPKNEELTPHQGVLFKLSPDGENLEIIASGLRNPNGLDINTDGEMIYSDNEGNWVPTSKVHRIKKGGFHGFIPSAHQPDKPKSFVPPISWVPHYMDNSPAKPMFITSDQWPKELQDDLILASYGRANLSLILKEEVDGVWQGAHLSLPYIFKSGLERGRFHADGNLYVTGMTSWQCIGEDWGSFHRMRYTGKPLNIPVAINTKAGGIELRFSQTLDPKIAVNKENYALKKWTYPWTRQYGTRGKLYSVDKPGVTKPDLVQVRSIRLSKDRKSVFLEIPELKPGKISTSIGVLEELPEMIEASLGLVISINYQISADDGVELNQFIHKTIHRVPTEEFKK